MHVLLFISQFHFKVSGSQERYKNSAESSCILFTQIPTFHVSLFFPKPFEGQMHT